MLVIIYCVFREQALNMLVSNPPSILLHGLCFSHLMRKQNLREVRWLYKGHWPKLGCQSRPAQPHSLFPTLDPISHFLLLYFLLLLLLSTPIPLLQGTVRDCKVLCRWAELSSWNDSMCFVLARWAKGSLIQHSKLVSEDDDDIQLFHAKGGPINRNNSKCTYIIWLQFLFFFSLLILMDLSLDDKENGSGARKLSDSLGGNWGMGFGYWHFFILSLMWPAF